MINTNHGHLPQRIPFLSEGSKHYHNADQLCFLKLTFDLIYSENRQLHQTTVKESEKSRETMVINLTIGSFTVV